MSNPQRFHALIDDMPSTCARSSTLMSVTHGRVWSASRVGLGIDMASLLPHPISARTHALLAWYNPDRYRDSTRRIQLACSARGTPPTMACVSSGDKYRGEQPMAPARETSVATSESAKR